MTYIIAKSEFEALSNLREADLAIMVQEGELKIILPDLEAGQEFAEAAWLKGYQANLRSYIVKTALLTIKKSSNVTLEKFISDMNLEEA